MGSRWAETLSEAPGTELAGWADAVAGRVDEAAGRLGIPEVVACTDVSHGIELVGPDFVVDATPPEMHHDVTLAALAAGVPVLGEKPMAVSISQAKEMVAASESTGKLYMVSQSRRYDRRLHAYGALLAERIGMLGSLSSDFFLGPHFGGFREEMESPLLMDMAIHTFDAARLLCGGCALSVWCDEVNPPWSWFAGAASATAQFEMSGGVRYSYRGSWCSQGAHTSWDASWRAEGSEGVALWDGHTEPRADVLGPDGPTAVVGELDTTRPEWISGSLADFITALETGAEPMGECHDNILSLVMVFAAIKSARTRRLVDVADLL